MKDLRILAVAALLALGLACSAQAQMTDQSSSSTTSQQTVTTPMGDQTTTTQQTVTTPSSVETTPPDSTVEPSATEQGLPPGTGNLGIDNSPVDYSKNPYWSPKDWNYLNEAGGGS
jgi:hypothetical protein